MPLVRRQIGRAAFKNQRPTDRLSSKSSAFASAVLQVWRLFFGRLRRRRSAVFSGRLAHAIAADIVNRFSRSYARIMRRRCISCAGRRCIVSLRCSSISCSSISRFFRLHCLLYSGYGRAPCWLACAWACTRFASKACICSPIGVMSMLACSSLGKNSFSSSSI